MGSVEIEKGRLRKDAVESCAWLTDASRQSRIEGCPAMGLDALPWAKFACVKRLCHESR